MLSLNQLLWMQCTENVPNSLTISWTVTSFWCKRKTWKVGKVGLTRVVCRSWLGLEVEGQGNPIPCERLSVRLSILLVRVPPLYRPGWSEAGQLSIVKTRHKAYMHAAIKYERSTNEGADIWNCNRFTKITYKITSLGHHPIRCYEISRRAARSAYFQSEGAFATLYSRTSVWTVRVKTIHSCPTEVPL
jgi:hypothetical protein